MDVPKIHGLISYGSDTVARDGGHGRAALFLVESLMHLLVRKGVISREDFIETVEDAADVECELADTQRSSSPDMSGSLLYPLADAFRRELGR